MNLPHRVTIVTPATAADRRNDITRDYGNAATRTQVDGWMQQQGSTETHTAESDDRRSTRWVLFTVDTPDLTSLHRVEWNGDAYEVDGKPNHLETPRGYHHSETPLLLLEG